MIDVLHSARSPYETAVVRRRIKPGAPSGAWRRRPLAFDHLESRRLLSVTVADFPIRYEGGDPLGVASGASGDQNVWFTLSSNNIGMVNPSDPSNIVQYQIPTYDSGAGPIAAGPDGKYWFFEENADQFGVITPATGAITEIPLFDAAGVQVDGITAGPGGTVWFTEYNTNQIGMINATTGQITQFAVPTPGSQPYGIVEGPDGNIWFTEAGTNKVGMINPTTHVIQEFLIDSSGNDEAEGITVGPSGNLWITLAGTNVIYEMNPTTGGKIADYSDPTANAAPNSIALGSNGNLWFTEPGADAIAEVTPTGNFTPLAEEERAVGITSGSDGNLWFVASNYIGITSVNPTSRHATENSYTTTNADAADSIAAGPDGNLWFAQSGGYDQIGTFSPTTENSVEFPDELNADPIGVTEGPDGNIWFSERGTGDIGEITPAGQIAQHGTQSSNSTYGIAYDAVDGNLWYTEESGDNVGRMNPTTNASADFPVGIPDAAPQAITVDASGNLWFTEYGADQIGEFSPLDPNIINQYTVPGTPLGIAAGPDGNIWFTEEVGNAYKIGVFDPTSKTLLAPYPLPSGSKAGTITVGPDGNLWFADPTGYIGMITTGGKLSEYPVPNADPVGIAAGSDGNIWFTGDGTLDAQTRAYFPNVIGVVVLASADAPTQVAITTQPPGAVTSGEGFGLAVQVENSAGELDAYYVGNVSITLSSNPGGDTLAGTLTATVNDGVAFFTGLTLKDAAQGYAITASAAGLTSATTSPFNVTLGASQLDFTTPPPGDNEAGATFTISVAAEDSIGNIDTSYDGAVTLSLANNPGGAGSVLGGTLTVGAIDGEATFANLTLDKVGDGFTIEAASGTLESVASGGFDVTPAPTSQLVIQTEPSTTVIAGTPFSSQPVIVEEDQFGNVETADDGTEITAFVETGTGELEGTTEVTVSAGMATFDDLSEDLAGSFSLEFSNGFIASGPSNTIVVSPAAATKLVIGTQPSATAIAGVPFAAQPVIDEEDTYGNIETGDNSTIITASLNSGAGPLEGIDTAQVTRGVATFYDLSDDTAETISLGFISGRLSGALSSSIVVSPAAVTSVVFDQQPTSAIAGATISPAVTVMVEDAFGNTVTDDSSAVTLTLNGGTFDGGSSTATVTASAGVATFAGLTIDAAGTYTLLATDDEAMNSGLSDAFTISPAPASKVAFRQQPTNTTAGVVISPAVTVAVEDTFGNVVATDDSTVTLALSTGTFAGGSTTAAAVAANGVATFSGLAIDVAGTNTLSATDGVLTPTGASNSFTVSPAAASKLVFGNQPTNAIAGAIMSPEVTVDVEDTFGNVVTSNSTVVTLTLNTGTFKGGSATTNVQAARGVATFGNLIIDGAGTYAITATDGALASTGASNSFAISPAAASKLVFGQQPTNATAGVAISPAVTVHVEDAFGNPVLSDSSTVTLTLSAGTFGEGSSAVTAIASSGVATFSGLVIDVAGNYTVSATDGNLTRSGSSSAFTVSAAAASKVVLGQQPTNVIAGALITPAVTVIVEDAFGNAISSDSSTVTLTLNNGSFVAGSSTVTAAASAGMATFPGLAIDIAGSYTLSATDGALVGSGLSNSFTVSPAAPSNLVVQTQPSSAATAGQAFTVQPVVDEVDRYGNLETDDSSVIVTASLATGAGSLEGTTTAQVDGGVATFADLSDDVAQLIALRFTSGSLPATVSSTIEVAAAAATHLVVTVPPPSSVMAGSPFGLTISAEDPFGNVDPTFDGAVSLVLANDPGSGNLTGTTQVSASDGVADFDALLDLVKAATGYTIRATNSSLTEATTADFNVSAAPATRLVIEEQPPATINAGSDFEVRVAAEDPYGNIDPSFAGPVAIVLATNPGGGALDGTLSQSAVMGSATFVGLTLASPGTGYELRISSSGVASTTTSPFNITPIDTTTTLTGSQAPTIVLEKVVTIQKTNKKGKPHGKPVFAGFELQFSSAMNASTAGLAANYQVDSLSTRHIKKKTVKVLKPVSFTAAYSQSTDAVTLTVGSSRPFAKGGMITILASSTTGVSSAAGTLLNPRDVSFTILPKAKGIVLD